MIDSTTEVNPTTEKPQTLNAYDRYEKAQDCISVLQNEISNLKETDITPENATFIAGLYLGRMKEVLYLQNFSIEEGAEEPGEEWRLELGRNGRINTGKLQQIMIDAQGGNFIPLKQFVESEANEVSSYKSIDEDKQAEEKWKKTGDIILKIAKKIPNSGDGSIIKTPSPVWMEEPAPLRIQLEMLKEGKL